MQATINCDNIGNACEGARGAINAAIQQAMTDIDDRGDDEKPRKVVITLEFRKISGRDVAISCEVGTATPKYRTPDTIGKILVEGGKAKLLFNDLAFDDASQTTIDDEIDRNTKGAK